MKDKVIQINLTDFRLGCLIVAGILLGAPLLLVVLRILYMIDLRVLTCLGLDPNAADPLAFMATLVSGVGCGFLVVYRCIEGHWFWAE